MILVIDKNMTWIFMGFNFRKSLKIVPSVRINVTKKGVSSLSVGKNGARVNIGKKGTKTTVGIPGSGLSYSKNSSYNRPPSLPSQNTNDEKSIGFGTLLVIGILLLFPIIWIFG